MSVIIRIQPSEVHQERVLLGSDLPDPAAARREVGEWMQRHHFQIPRGARPLSVFENGVLVREWVVAERASRLGIDTEWGGESAARQPAVNRDPLRLWRRRETGGKDDLFLPLGPDSAA